MKLAAPQEWGTVDVPIGEDGIIAVVRQKSRGDDERFLRESTVRKGNAKTGDITDEVDRVKYNRLWLKHVIAEIRLPVAAIDHRGIKLAPLVPGDAEMDLPEPDDDGVIHCNGEIVWTNAKGVDITLAEYLWDRAPSSVCADVVARAANDFDRVVRAKKIAEELAQKKS